MNKEELKLLEILGIKEINYLHLDYTDIHGNFKEIKIENRRERGDE